MYPFFLYHMIANVGIEQYQNRSCHSAFVTGSWRNNLRAVSRIVGHLSSNCDWPCCWKNFKIYILANCYSIIPCQFLALSCWHIIFPYIHHWINYIFFFLNEYKLGFFHCIFFFQLSVEDPYFVSIYYHLYFNLMLLILFS